MPRDASVLNAGLRLKCKTCRVIRVMETAMLLMIMEMIKMNRRRVGTRRMTAVIILKIKILTVRVYYGIIYRIENTPLLTIMFAFSAVIAI